MMWQGGCRPLFDQLRAFWSWRRGMAADVNAHGSWFYRVAKNRCTAKRRLRTEKREIKLKQQSKQLVALGRSNVSVDSTAENVWIL